MKLEEDYVESALLIQEAIDTAHDDVQDLYEHLKEEGTQNFGGTFKEQINRLTT
jgi:hypothetical protein